MVWEGAGESSANDERPGEPALDPVLWFTTGHCEGRHYLLGNPHTFPGRLSAWCPSMRRGFSVSKSEIAECSNETTYFVKGFLSGQEAGAPSDEAGDLLPPDDASFEPEVHLLGRARAALNRPSGHERHACTSGWSAC